MKLVIEIDEERYSDVKNQVKNGIDNPLKVIIANGTPLPTDAVDRVTIKEYLDSFGKDTNVTSTDAIDRQAVIDTLTKTGGIRGDALKALYDLPSVTPQQKMGRWIDEKDGYGTRCSECGKWYSHSILTKQEVLYCCSCGAKMQEVEV